MTADIREKLSRLSAEQKAGAKYDAISRRIDAINDIILGCVSDREFGEIMALEAEILKEAAKREADA